MSAKFSPSLMCMDLTQFKEQITAMNKKADFYHVDIGNDSNLLIVFYVQIVPDDFVMQLHRF